MLIARDLYNRKHSLRNIIMHDFFCLGLTALEVWCLAMIGLVFLVFLAYIVILSWLRTRLIHVGDIYVFIMIITTIIIIII